MRFPSARYLLAVLLPLSGNAFGQLNMSARSDGGNYTLTFTLGSASTAPAIIGAPYSGRQVSRSLRILGDGARIKRASAMEVLLYRDSAGRTRTERPAFGDEPPGEK